VTDMAERAAPVDTVDFGGLSIAFDDRVLRPREWTTAQSHWGAALLRDLADGEVLELCSGAGQIGLLAIVGSTRRLVCVDVNPVAAAYTLKNAETAGLADQVSVRTGPMTEVLDPGERFPLVIADPPWVPRADTSRFPEDPLVAIDGGDDGLQIIRDCLQVIDTHLAPGGAAVLQLGTTGQVAAVAALLEGTDLVAGEIREYGDRGVLVQIDRPT
jgi:methylase of polypeptide subunit release factors